MKLKLTDAKLKRYATILAAVTTIISLTWGFIVFRHTSIVQADAAAVKMMQDYLQWNLVIKM